MVFYPFETTSSKLQFIRQITEFNPFFDAKKDLKPKYKNVLYQRKYLYKKTKAGLKQLKIDINSFSNVIHVFGSCGKGSVATVLANLLKQSGHTVGLIVKPHLVSVKERFNINGKIPTDKHIKFLANYINSKLGSDYPYLAKIFLAELFYLQQYKPNYLIVEAGIGASYDYTDIFRKHSNYYGVITSICPSHKEVLGNSLENIFLSKVSLAKYTKKTFLFFNPDQFLSNLNTNLKSIDTFNKLVFAQANYRTNTSVAGSLVVLKDKIGNLRKIKTNLFSHLHIKNLVYGLYALHKIDHNLDIFKTEQKVLNVFLPGRNFIGVYNKSLVVIDNSHTVTEYKNLREFLNKYFSVFKKYQIFISTYGKPRLINAIKVFAKLGRATVGQAANTESLNARSANFSKDNYRNTIKIFLLNLNLSWLSFTNINRKVIQILKNQEHKKHNQLAKYSNIKIISINIFSFFKQINRKALNLVTGSNYLIGPIILFLKYPYYALNNSHTKKTIGLQKKAARQVLQNSILKYTNKKQDEKIINQNLKYVVTKLKPEKIGVFIPIKNKEPELKISILESLIHISPNVEIYVPCLNKLQNNKKTSSFYSAGQNFNWQICKLNNKLLLQEYKRQKCVNFSQLKNLSWNNIDKALIEKSFKDFKSAGFTGFLKTKSLEEHEQSNIRSLILVPAIAVDKFGNRIGHGYGIYDRLLYGITGVWALPYKANYYYNKKIELAKASNRVLMFPYVYKVQILPFIADNKPKTYNTL